MSHEYSNPCCFGCATGRGCEKAQVLAALAGEHGRPMPVRQSKFIRPKKVYVAGPMRGRPYFNFPAFNAAAARLRELGYVVFNPAERDTERHGTDVSAGNVKGDEKQAAREHGFSLRVALGEDLAWICAHADAIALLPGWEASKGARAEYYTALALGLEVMELA